jgi:hypothetical protein
VSCNCHIKPGHILAGLVKLYKDRGTIAVVPKEELPNFLGDAGYLWRRPTVKEWKAAVKEIRSQIAARRERERQGEAGEGVRT